MVEASEHHLDLVTGATGMLGSHIAERLVERGRTVRALVRPGSKTGSLERLGVELVPGDLTDRDVVPPGRSGSRPRLPRSGESRRLGSLDRVSSRMHRRDPESRRGRDWRGDRPLPSHQLYKRLWPSARREPAHR